MNENVKLSLIFFLFTCTRARIDFPVCRKMKNVSLDLSFHSLLSLTFTPKRWMNENEIKVKFLAVCDLLEVAEENEGERESKKKVEVSLQS